ncbi:MAG: ATP-binding cassette domain-containing protein [Bacilli bacterium]|nr:ATP-binding cassette domain-containing protein [Bacilli bacterium]
MLELKNIKKSYKTGTFIQHALNDIDLRFRKNEFVAILGPSGSGKTTLLNIIGGLDRYDEGDLIIKGKSTKKFKDKDWDAYRNKSVGFIFQSYNLISHISLIDNIEMGMTLSGKSSKVRRKKAKELLKKVGLEEHAHKKPNQLSGGQMQRVAIARALANDPEIILADEPTGALDTKTSKQIMNLIESIAKDKLVIMVTHNPELANDYADRIIEMKDGKIINDSNPVEENVGKDDYKLNKTKMSFFTALHLSLNNIRTKKGRTILTAFASSIGIIGIALILALSNGFQNKINEFEHQVSDAMPVVISATKMNLSAENMSSIISSETGMSSEKTEDDFTDSKTVKKEEKEEQTFGTSINPITKDFVDYVDNIPKEYVSGIIKASAMKYNIIQKTEDKYVAINNLNVNSMSIPNVYGDNKSSIIDKYYDLLAGRRPEKYDEIVVEVGKDNSLSKDFVKSLGLKGNEYSFDDILSCTMKVVSNDNYYLNIGNYFIPKEINDSMYNLDDNITLKVVGIVRIKEDKYSTIGISDSNRSFYYLEELDSKIKDINYNSLVAKTQREVDFDVFTGMEYDMESDLGKYYKHINLMNIGALETPGFMYIYPKDFDSTDNIVDYLNKYNENKDEKDKIDFINQAELVNNMTGSIMGGITSVLIAFSSISLIVSSIMLGIITYISVLERTKEIGILRSLGARKKDIKRVFNAETTIIGVTSGVLGILIANLLTIPINLLIKNITTLDNVATLNPIHATILIIISVVLTLIGGSIPAHVASKQDPVASLRSE